MAFQPRLEPQARPLRCEHTLLLAILFAVAAGGCAGAKPKQIGEENNFSETPTNSESSSEEASNSGDGAVGKDGLPQKESWAPSPKEPETGGLNADQKAQIEIVLRRGGDKAAHCATVVADAPSGEGKVKVVFDGKKGRCVDVIVGAPFADTPVESCIKRSFVGEIVLPFEGGELEVPYTVKLAAKASADADSGKDAKGKKK